MSVHAALTLFVSSQLEAEYRRQKEREKEREMLGKMGEDSDEEREREKYRVALGTNDDVPFACHLCRGPFKEPMQTLCQHYFCSSCAQQHFRDVGQRCPICNKQTYGVLNAAPKLKAKAAAVGGFEQLFMTGAVVDDVPETAEHYKGEAPSAQHQKRPTVGRSTVASSQSTPRPR